MTPPTPTGTGVLGAPPEPLTPLIGRADELARIAGLLGPRRLVTVTGAGGSGKTRLAYAVTQVCPYPRRLWVSLADLDTAELVPAAVAEVVGAARSDPASLAGALEPADSAGNVLLVLDTCEHLADAVAELVEPLLRGCPRLTVLATSRTPLRAAGELLAPAAPLGDAAVELFVSRARAVRPELDPDPTGRTLIARICARLDQNPLAIELCAARCAVLSLTEIDASLADAGTLLSGGDRSAPARQRTLAATLDWSHRLLSDEAQRLFAQLSVFRGGATLDAIAVLVAASPLTVLDRIGELVDSSLLRLDAEQRPARYVLPEPVRQYAARALADLGAEESARDALLRWCGDLAASAPGSDPDSLVQLEAELPNFRAALAWAGRRGHAVAALRLAADLIDFMHTRGHYREARDWLDTTLAAAGDDADPALQARAEHGAGMLAVLVCDYATATRWLERALALLVTLNDDAGIALAIRRLGGIAREQGDLVRSEALLRSSRGIYEALGDPAGVGELDAQLGFLAVVGGDGAVARARADAALETARWRGDPTAVCTALVIRGAAAMVDRELGTASACFAEVRALAVAGSAEELAYAEEGLGLIALIRGDLAPAAGLLAASLRRHHELGDRWRLSSLLVDIATWSRVAGHPAASARFLGASEAELGEIGATLGLVEQLGRDDTIRIVEGQLSSRAFRAAWATGRTEPTAVTVAAALELLASAREPAPAAAPTVDVSGPPGATAAAGRIELLLLGGDVVRVDGRTLGPADFGYAKPRELLSFLAAAGPMSDDPGVGPVGVDKASIGLALWPELGAGDLRSAFHTTLHALRRAVGTGRVVFDAGRYHLAAAGLSVDLAAFVDELDRARAAQADDPGGAAELDHLQRAVGAYGGDFLGAAPWEWAGPIRDRLRLRHHRALLAVARISRRTGDLGAAVDTLYRLLDADPLAEAAHRELMRNYVAQGEPGRALSQYAVLVDRLHVELGASPSAASTQLRDAVLAGRSV